MRQATLTPTDNGMFVIASDPDCTTPYSGAFKRATIYIVDALGEPQLFVRSQRTHAMQIATQQNKTINHVPAGQLCDSRMRELFQEG